MSDAGAGATEAEVEHEKHLHRADTRRVMRNKYRKLQRQVLANKDQITQLGGTELAQYIEDANNLNKNVRHLREQAVDSELMVLLSDQTLALVNKLKPGTSNVQPRDCLAGLKRKYARGYGGEECVEPSDFDWVAFGNAVGRYWRHAPAQGCMLGPLDVAPKQKKARQAGPRGARGPLAELATADMVTEQEEGPTDTDRNMQTMSKACKRFMKDEARCPSLPLTVNNPDSFAQTVENMFALSFLVRDGNIGLHDGDESDAIMVQRHKKPSEEDWKEGTAEATQFAVSFTMADWRAMQKAARDEGPPLMAHRDPAEVDAAGRLLEHEEEDE
jgi:hypothetical protein